MVVLYYQIKTMFFIEICVSFVCFAYFFIFDGKWKEKIVVNDSNETVHRMFSFWGEFSVSLFEENIGA